MPFPFVIRKLKKILYNEEILALRHDRFAAGRVVELKNAITLLEGGEAPKPVRNRTSNTKQLNLFA